MCYIVYIFCLRIVLLLQEKTFPNYKYTKGDEQNDTPLQQGKSLAPIPVSPQLHSLNMDGSCPKQVRGTNGEIREHERANKNPRFRSDLGWVRTTDFEIDEGEHGRWRKQFQKATWTLDARLRVSSGIGPCIPQIVKLKTTGEHTAYSILKYSLLVPSQAVFSLSRVHCLEICEQLAHWDAPIRLQIFDKLFCRVQSKIQRSQLLHPMKRGGISRPA